MKREKLFIVKIDETKCTGCGLCADACPLDAITMEETAKIDTGLCAGCRACIDECPVGAIYTERKDAEASSETSQTSSSHVTTEPDPQHLRRPSPAGNPGGFQPKQSGGLLNQVFEFLTDVGNFSAGQNRGRGRGRGGNRGLGLQRGRGCGNRRRA